MRLIRHRIEQEIDKQMQKWHRYHHVANSGRVLLQACRSSSASGVMETSRDCVHRVVVLVGAGVEGSSTALHNTRCEAGPVLLLEQVET